MFEVSCAVVSGLMTEVFIRLGLIVLVGLCVIFKETHCEITFCFDYT